MHRSIQCQKHSDSVTRPGSDILQLLNLKPTYCLLITHSLSLALELYDSPLHAGLLLQLVDNNIDIVGNG